MTHMRFDFFKVSALLNMLEQSFCVIFCQIISAPSCNQHWHDGAFGQTQLVRPLNRTNLSQFSFACQNLAHGKRKKKNGRMEKKRKKLDAVTTRANVKWKVS